MLKMVHAALTGAKPMADKVAATAFSIVLAIFICAVSLDFVGGLRKEVAELSKNRAVLLQEKRDAYDWLARSTDRNVRVIALEDASLYLYSGRVALRPRVAHAVAAVSCPRKSEKFRILSLKWLER